MLGLRFFLPFVFILVVVSGFFHYVWLPGYIELEKEAQYEHEQEFLTLLGEALIPSLLFSDYAAAYDVIDRVKARHKRFKYIELFHPDGTRLYPLTASQQEIQSSLATVEYSIDHKGEDIGLLKAKVDLAEYIAHEIEEVKQFEYLVLSLLLLLLAVTAAMQYRWASTPIKKLAKAATKIAQGEYDAELPGGVGKDLKEFISSFDLMRRNLKSRERQIQRQLEVEDAIRDIQTNFIAFQDKRMTFQKILDHIMYLTGGQIGLIGEVGYEDGVPYIGVYAISNIAWDVESRKAYESLTDGEMKISAEDNLFGAIVASGKVVISTDLKNDPRGGGFPKGHPDLKNFLGVPLYNSQSILIGVACVADAQQDFTDETHKGLEVLWLAIGNLIDAQHKRRALLQREAELSNARQELTKANEKLEKMVRTDALTGIANRRYFDEVLVNEFSRAVRQSIPLTLLLFDIDYFKKYNDQYGHPEGDKCLTRIAQLAATLFQRAGELVARYGGEEFAIIIPHSTAEAVVPIAEKLLRDVRNLDIPHETSVAEKFVTISIGMASVVPTTGDEPQSLVISADTALYQAKQNGRNQLVLTETPSA